MELQNQNKEKVFPARAGVILTYFIDLRLVFGLSRTSGGDPGQEGKD